MRDLVKGIKLEWVAGGEGERATFRTLAGVFPV